MMQILAKSIRAFQSGEGEVLQQECLWLFEEKPRGLACLENSEQKNTLVIGEREVTQLCPTVCNPMDCSLPGSSTHGIFQARTLKWVASSFSRGSSWPRDQTWVSFSLQADSTVWATREAPIINYREVPAIRSDQIRSVAQLCPTLCCPCNKWGQNSIAFECGDKNWVLNPWNNDWTEKVCWLVLSEADFEKELGIQVTYCKSLQGKNVKGGRSWVKQRKPPDFEADLRGNVRRSRIEQGELQTIIWIMTQIWGSVGQPNGELPSKSFPWGIPVFLRCWLGLPLDGVTSAQTEEDLEGTMLLLSRFSRVRLCVTP